jgi:hypothetical protein
MDYSLLLEKLIDIFGSHQLERAVELLFIFLAFHNPYRDLDRGISLPELRGSIES